MLFIIPKYLLGFVSFNFSATFIKTSLCLSVLAYSSPTPFLILAYDSACLPFKICTPASVTGQSFPPVDSPIYLFNSSSI